MTRDAWKASQAAPGRSHRPAGRVDTDNRCEPKPQGLRGRPEDDQETEEDPWGRGESRHSVAMCHWHVALWQPISLRMLW